MCLDCVTDNVPGDHYVQDTIDSYYKQFRSHNELLHEAVKYSRIDIIDKILDQGGDINCTMEGLPLVMHAIKHGNREIVEYLIESGCICHDPDEFEIGQSAYSVNGVLVREEYYIQYARYVELLNELLSLKCPGPEIVEYISDFDIDFDDRDIIEMMNDHYTEATIRTGRT